MNDTEAKRILSVLSMNKVKKSIENPICKILAGGDKETALNNAIEFEAGKIVARLQHIEKDELTDLPPLEEIADNKARKQNIGDPESNDAYKYLYKLIWQAYRYGYYQAIDDMDN